MWNAPLVPNGIIRGYQIEYSSRVGEGPIIDIPVQNQFTITSLEPFTLYSISLSARTVIMGPRSTISVMTQYRGMCNRMWWSNLKRSLG